jgi:twinkle protein
LDDQYKDNSVITYLQTERGIDRKTLRKYGVGRASYKFPSDQGGYESAECVTFPWILRQDEIQTQEDLRGGVASSSSSSSSGTEQEKLVTRRIKVRAVSQKAWQRLDPPGGGWGLFGWHTIPKDAKEIVLTEGEYDAMAVHQATGLPSASLPNGCRSLPVQLLPLLERFDKIYLWMDNDKPGQEGAEKFAKKLGLNRCYLVKSSHVKDANDALLQDMDLQALVNDASLVPHERMLTFGDLRNDVLHELLQPDLYTGSPVPSLPQFTKLIKGFRRGELTVLTGSTGSGKTTFLGQISLDLAEQGINTLWGSFEIKNTRLLHKLLKQFARAPLPDHRLENAAELLSSIADRFQTLPLHFLKFHGGSDVDEVLDAMEYAVYVEDVEHIILDNMQFMISRKNQNKSWDKFDIQDMAIEKFRKFATEHNVHLSLVVHPRKEDESSKLNMSSFYGSAKATQEADTVLILQHDGRRKYIDVKKNRFDGTLGYAPLYFQSASGRYVETEGSGSPVQQHPIQFSPPQKAWRKKEVSEPEPKDLKNHWVNCLGSSTAPPSKS